MKINKKLLLIFVVSLFALPILVGAETFCSYSGPDLSDDLLRLTNFSVTGPLPLKEGDQITVRFDLQNYSRYDFELGQKGIFAATMDPDNLDNSFGFTRSNTTLRVGETVPLEVSRVLDKVGTWKIWPSYHFSLAREEKLGPNEWHSCSLNVSSAIKDSDRDGISDDRDNCPTVYNPDQRDSNQNGVGDACEIIEEIKDSDRDGISDDRDNCPTVYNPDQRDSNQNGIGDACEIIEEIKDSDRDGISDDRDNCPTVYNPDQRDSNQNGIGDACEQVEEIPEREIPIKRPEVTPGIKNPCDEAVILNEALEQLYRRKLEVRDLETYYREEAYLKERLSKIEFACQQGKPVEESFCARLAALELYYDELNTKLAIIKDEKEHTALKEKLRAITTEIIALKEKCLAEDISERKADSLLEAEKTYETKVREITETTKTEKLSEELKKLDEEKKKLIEESVQKMKELDLKKTKLIKKLKMSKDEVLLDEVKAPLLPVVVEVGEEDLRIEPALKGVVLEENGVKAEGDFELEYEDGKLIGGKSRKPIKVLPSDVAGEIKGELKKIRIEDDPSGIKYIVETKRKGKLFRFIPVSVPTSYEIDAENGRVSKEKKPWWSNLVLSVADITTQACASNFLNVSMVDDSSVPQSIKDAIFKDPGPIINTSSSLYPSGKIVVIRAALKDWPKNSAVDEAYIDEIFFGSNPANKSMKGYFMENSYGNFIVTKGAVPPWLTLKNKLTDYKKGIEANTQYMQDVLEMANVNWKALDANNDDIISVAEAQIVVLIPNGPVFASTRNVVDIGKVKTPKGDFTFDNRRIVYFSLKAASDPKHEVNPIRVLQTVAHELAHAFFRLTDYYGVNTGTGEYDMMGSAASDKWVHLTMDAKVKIGWVKPKILREHLGKCLLFVASELIDSALILVPSDQFLSNPLEYWIIENRNKISDKGGYDDDLPDNGLAVWYVSVGTYDGHNDIRLVDFNKPAQDPDKYNNPGKNAFFKPEPKGHKRILLNRNGEWNLLWFQNVSTVPSDQIGLVMAAEF